GAAAGGGYCPMMAGTPAPVRTTINRPTLTVAIASPGPSPTPATTATVPRRSWCQRHRTDPDQKTGPERLANLHHGAWPSPCCWPSATRRPGSPVRSAVLQQHLAEDLAGTARRLGLDAQPVHRPHVTVHVLALVQVQRVGEMLQIDDIG